MKKSVFILVLFCLGLIGCKQEKTDGDLIHRTFYETTWERFDYLYNVVEIDDKTTYNLSMKISFTDDYPYDDFSMVFTVFTDEGVPYRSKAYKYRLKDPEGHWNSELIDGCYTFDLPVNKNFCITDPGKYRFQIEYRMPITPLVGVKELTLVNNKSKESDK